MAQKTKITNLADRRKKIEAIYSSDSQTRNILRQSLSSAGGSTFNQTTLDRIINSVGSIGSNIDDVSKISNFAYSTEPIYAGIIDYLANMYLWRYYYLPVKIKEKANPKNYEEVYNLMTEIIDGLNIEVTFPTILTKLLKEGVVFLYTEKNTSSKTISTLILNPKFCRPVMMSQYGTGIYQFDAKYFESLGASSEKLEEILELFPKELVEGYRAYKKDSKNQYFLVDGRFGTYVSLNEHHFPTKLAILKNIFDYHRYRENEVERSSATLDKIITHRIPIFENQPIFDLSEVASLHKSMSGVFNKNTRTKLMTTFGEVEIHSLQESNRVQNETLERGVQGVYQGGGFNTSLFFGGNQDALISSLTRDASIM